MTTSSQEEEILDDIINNYQWNYSINTISSGSAKLQNIDDLLGHSQKLIMWRNNEPLQKTNATDALVREALFQIIEFRREHQLQYDSLLTANLEIKKQQSEILQLQNNLREKTEDINDLLLTRKNANRIYYAGVATGIISGVGGAVFNNFVYLFVGFGICITALTGLWEAKRNVC